MADVFLSYRREDRKAVETIASQLRSLGLSVWFDASMNAGQAFADEIDREVRAAKVVLVCWSETARASRWVKAEALIGFEKDALAACYITGPDQFSPPTPFNAVHTEDLRNWLASPDLRCAQWRAILRQIGALCERNDIEVFGRFDPGDAESFYDRGEAFFVGGHKELAISDFTEALRLNPKLTKALYLRADAYEDFNKDLAIADYTEAMRLDPQGPEEALSYRGNVYFDRRDFARAIADYSELILLDPTNPWSYTLRAAAYEEIDDYLSAIADHTAAFELEPLVNFLTSRSYCFRAIGDDVRADADLEQAQALESKNAH